jgi:hypothetical protein
LRTTVFKLALKQRSAGFLRFSISSSERDGRRRSALVWRPEEVYRKYYRQRGRSWPVTRFGEENSSYNQPLTASDPSSPQFTCHNSAAMRFPNRIPISNAPTSTAPPRILAPVETLPAKPQIEKNKKVLAIIP